MGLKCPFCKDPKILPIDKGDVDVHLIVTKDHQRMVHVHGPVSNRAVIQDLVTAILREAGIAYRIVPDEESEEEEAPEEASEVPEDDKE